MAKDLREFLRLTEDGAADQWRHIRHRTVPRGRKRQEDFLPVEVLLCYGLFWCVDPHRYGGRNILTVPAEVRSLAATFRRSPGSITSKMLNLDNSRENGWRLEVELYARLAEARDLYADLYRTVLRAARSTGFAADQVPDFLGLLTETDAPELLGQDEIGSDELEQALRETAGEVRRLHVRTGASDRQTERLVEQRIRLGQHRFARRVLHDYDNRCGFCGFAPGDIPKSRLLVASHIKPWRDSTARERLDPRNGIAACPTHDSAFDGGLLTVNGRRRIHRAGPLDVLVVRDATAARSIGADALRHQLVLPEGAPGPAPRYLDWHHRHVFRAG